MLLNVAPFSGAWVETCVQLFRFSLLYPRLRGRVDLKIFQKIIDTY